MQRRLKIGVLYSRVRVEEKWIFGAMEKRGIDYDRLDDRAISFDLEKPEPWKQYDAVLERSISYNSGLYALRLLNSFGVPTVNTAAVAEVCGDKLMTSAVLARDGVPQPHNVTAFSNGANIHQPRVQDALLENVTSVRVSMYDWQEGESEHFLNTLRKIEGLRNRIEREGSRLEIGASILTRTDLNHRYEAVGLRALAAGIDWLYFHPYCVDWEERLPKQADQTGVLAALESLRAAAPGGANIQVPVERYSLEPLFFEKLHGSHFLIQVGADGVNYAGPECKYEAAAALLDLNDYLEEDFLWHHQRLERLDGIHSGNYRFGGTKQLVEVGLAPIRDQTFPCIVAIPGS